MTIHNTYGVSYTDTLGGTFHEGLGISIMHLWEYIVPGNAQKLHLPETLTQACKMKLVVTNIRLSFQVLPKTLVSDLNI